MARDGLLFNFLARVSERKAPITATIAAGVMSGKMDEERWGGKRVESSGREGGERDGESERWVDGRGREKRKMEKRKVDRARDGKRKERWGKEKKDSDGRWRENKEGKGGTKEGDVEKER